MNIILGFGKTETDFENQEFNFVEEFVSEYAKNNKGFEDNGFYDEKFKEEFNKAFQKREKHYKKLDEEFKTATEFPERYSYFYSNILSDYASLCIVFKFYHVNRHHPFSPDGWALMTTKKVCYIDLWDFI